MSRELSANGLHSISLTTSAESWKAALSLPDEPDERIESFHASITNALEQQSCFVAYLDYRVVIGTWHHERGCDFYKERSDEQLDPKYIQRLRVFNAEKELLVWRSNNTLKSRIRRDDLKGKDNIAIMAHQVLFGTRIDESFTRPGFTRITEDRGTSLILPFKKLTLSDTQRVCIKTHNYLQENRFGQVDYADCRFVGFTDGKNNLPYERRDA